MPEHEEAGVPRKSTSNRPSTPKDEAANPFVSATMEFLADLLDDPSTKPADRITAGKALLQGPAPARRKSKGQRKRPRIVYIGEDGTVEKGSVGAAPPDSAVVQRRTTLLQFVEIMNNEGIPTPVRIRAAKALLTEGSSAPADERTPVIYLDALDRLL